jgi:uncharacterized membrane protein
MASRHSTGSTCREPSDEMSSPHTEAGRRIPRRLLKGTGIHHPAVIDEAIERNASFELRVADRITAFAGSMSFVFIHAALFAVWMSFLERSPWPTLTLVVSLEAIFLSTFVMIGQNRQAAFQQAKADHDFEAQELELKTNTELTRQIHVLTQELHRRLIGGPETGNHESLRPDPVRPRRRRSTSARTSPQGAVAPPCWMKIGMVKWFTHTFGGSARSYQPAVHFESQAQLGNIAGLRQGTPGALLNAMQPVPHGVRMTEQQFACHTK